MTQLNVHTRLVRVDHLASTELDEEIVLLSIDQGAYYGLELTARRIWELLAREQTVADLCQQLGSEYEVEPATCEGDVLAFLKELHDEGLIVVA